MELVAEMGVMLFTLFDNMVHVNVHYTGQVYKKFTIFVFSNNHKSMILI